MELSEAGKVSPLLQVLHTEPPRTIPLDLYANRRQLEVTSFVLGIAIHFGLFRKGEWDLAANTICKAYACIFVLVDAALLFANGSMNASFAAESFAHASSLLAIHGLGVLLSISVYRQWFHPLRSFPGPALAGTSSLYMTLLSLRYHQSETLQEYHRVYGDYVRICPNKLSITDPAAIVAIYGRGSPTAKGPFSNTNPRANINMCRDKVEHTRRRRFWDRALSTSSLRSRIPIVNKHATRLLGQLNARTGYGIDVTKWLALFSFDLLFDIGFGLDKQSIERGHGDSYMTCAQYILSLTGLVMHIPWMLYFCSWSPTFSARIGRFGKLSADAVHERLANPGDRGDLFSIIARSYDELSNKTTEDLENLIGDADLLVLAGADSIAAAISNVLYELAMNPSEQDILRQALSVMTDFEDFQVRGNVQMDAVINESLRVNPPAPAGHERITPPEGLRIGERFIPGNVSVFIPHYALFRDARFFDKPASFVPERWTTNPALNKDASVFFPFQTGRNVCPGRPLALMEMRTVIFLILSRFTVHPASSDMTTRFIDKRDDRWLLAVGELNVVLRELDEQ